GVGSGVYKSVPEACEATIQVKTKQQADQAMTAKYNEYYKLYKNLYQSLKQDFKTLAKLV
ncbi:MAG: xylulokinase, partial [Ruminiclostridium sp.]|nr:xylulokinase [Ruminiclostridium sp.]